MFGKYLLGLLLCVLFIVPGCSGHLGAVSVTTPSITTGNSTPKTVAVVDLSQYTGDARLAGIASVSVFKMTDPNLDQVAALRDVVNLLRANLSAYGSGGFSGALPGIQTAIGLKYSDKSASSAHAFAALALAGLDVLFAKHPEWQAQGANTAALINAFLDGVAAGLPAKKVADVPAEVLNVDIK